MQSYLKMAVALLSFMASPRGIAAAEPAKTFTKQHVNQRFTSEGATILDANRDGNPDIASGGAWYAGPKFETRTEFRPEKTFDINGYSDHFLSFTADFNKDGWDDIFEVGFPGKEVYWYENPQGKPGPWPRHLVLDKVDSESPSLSQVVGDKMPEFVCIQNGCFGYATCDVSNPKKPWTFIPVSENRGYVTYTHGLGVGDLNGDGRQDLLLREGWWEQPETLDGKTPWKFHPFLFSEPGGAQMLVADFDGDGDNDVVTSKNAHAYGLAWFENVPDGDSITFREHKITGTKPEENEFGVAFSQAHGLALADMDGDGVMDFVTGKRWWAHSEHDPGSLEPAVLYWFRTERKDGKVRFVPILIDDDSGVGTQVTVGNLNHDDKPDIVVGNKKGTFVFLRKE